MNIKVYDPYADKESEDCSNYEFEQWPNKLESADFVVVTCALNRETEHMINADTISKMKKGVRIVNVSRGPVIDEEALIHGLKSNKVHSVGLDVFEIEPLPANSELRDFERSIFGTHNGSNTIDGVRRATGQAMKSIFEFLGV